MNRKVYTPKAENIQVSPGKVTGKVVAVQSRPLIVELRCKLWDSDEWLEALQLIASRAAFAAELMNGELSVQIYNELSKQDILLHIPQHEWTTSCTCQMKSCQHVEAMHAALSELITADPLIQFELRGLDRDVFLSRLRQIRSGNTQMSNDNQEYANQEDAEQQEQFKPITKALKNDLKLFTPYPDPAFWTKETTLCSLMHPVYHKISGQAQQILNNHQKKIQERGNA